MSTPSGLSAAAVSSGASPRSGRARRTLHYTSLGDILGDVESFAAGPVLGLGGWTPAQNIDHVRRLIRISREGADFTMPLPIRVLGRLLKPLVLRKPFKPGSKTLEALEPPAEIGLDEAVTAFRDEVLLASPPGAMSQPSALFGPMTHDDWVRLHCRHAELHLSYVVPEAAG